jgi:hypothetical protein
MESTLPKGGIDSRIRLGPIEDHESESEQRKVRVWLTGR